MPVPAMRVEGLTKLHAGGKGFSHVSFDANPGDVIGVLGPNGAGKTTLLRVLTTLLDPDEGSFDIGGFPHTRPREIRRVIGVLPESDGSYDHLTGAEVVTYFGELHGLARANARERATMLLAEVGLSERADTLVKTYSRGMKQRLGIARALVNAPRVLLLDEPTLGLDPLGQLDLLATMRRIARERQATILLCTHQIEDVEELANRVLIMRDGRVVAQGSPDEIRHRVKATRSARIQVPSATIELAASALARAGLQPVVDTARPGYVRVQFDETPSPSSRDVLDALRALHEAGVPFLRVEREGARLTEAFLALTQQEADA